MKKLFLYATALMLPLAASAQDAPPPANAPAGEQHMMEGGHRMEGKHHQPKTLEQARERAHKRAEKLDKMTPEEWDAKQKKRAERREAWEKMTPEERAAKKAEWKEKHADKHEGHGGGDAPAPAAAQ